jgi:ankyrin repeat protein
MSKRFRVDLESLVLRAIEEDTIDERQILFEAVKENNLYLIQMLLRAGANPNIQSIFGRNPLHAAIIYDNDGDIIRLLLNSGANPNIQENTGHTPLHIAIRTNKHEAIEDLVPFTDIFLFLIEKDVHYTNCYPTIIKLLLAPKRRDI